MDPSDPESMKPKITHDTYFEYEDSVKKGDKTQYSFFINTFNYKESLLKDSIRILDSYWDWNINHGRKPLFKEVE